jgi:hypothetical protein
VIWAETAAERRKVGIDVCVAVIEGRDTEKCQDGITAVQFFGTFYSKVTDAFVSSLWSQRKLA